MNHNIRQALITGVLVRGEFSRADFIQHQGAIKCYASINRSQIHAQHGHLQLLLIHLNMILQIRYLTAGVTTYVIAWMLQTCSMAPSLTYTVRSSVFISRLYSLKIKSTRCLYVVMARSETKPLTAIPAPVSGHQLSTL